MAAIFSRGGGGGGGGWVYMLRKYSRFYIQIISMIVDIMFKTPHNTWYFNSIHFLFMPKCSCMWIDWCVDGIVIYAKVLINILSPDNDWTQASAIVRWAIIYDSEGLLLEYWPSNPNDTVTIRVDVPGYFTVSRQPFSITWSVRKCLHKIIENNRLLEKYLIL